MLWAAKDRERLRALHDRVAALQAELDEATARHDALSTRIGEAEQRSRVQSEQHDEQASLLARFDESLAALQGTVADQAALLARQASALDTLGETRERQERALEQLRADLARTQRQAELDLAEMRETNTAVIASVLLKRAERANDVQ